MKELKTYDVWMEGYRVLGNEQGAELLGSATAETFKEACDIVCMGDDHYDSYAGEVWGCRLYDNEEEARKSFG